MGGYPTSRLLANGFIPIARGEEEEEGLLEYFFSPNESDEEDGEDGMLILDTHDPRAMHSITFDLSLRVSWPDATHGGGPEPDLVLATQARFAVDHIKEEALEDGAPKTIRVSFSDRPSEVALPLGSAPCTALRCEFVIEKTEDGGPLYLVGVRGLTPVMDSGVGGAVELRDVSELLARLKANHAAMQQQAV